VRSTREFAFNAFFRNNKSHKIFLVNAIAHSRKYTRATLCVAVLRVAVLRHIVLLSALVNEFIGMTLATLCATDLA